MSSVPTAANGALTLEQEVQVLRDEVHLLCERVRHLEIQLSSSARASAPSSTTSSVELAGSALSAERLAAAKDVGRWITRCLNNQHRGLSGRERISLASRLYLVIRDFEGVIRSPPLVLFSWRETSAIVSPRGQPGDSIYVGLPSKEEARLALREAGLSLPPALQRA